LLYLPAVHMQAVRTAHTFNSGYSDAAFSYLAHFKALKTKLSSPLSWDLLTSLPLAQLSMWVWLKHLSHVSHISRI
jgi:hypothetical protein